jgi:hypothetical protein
LVNKGSCLFPNQYLEKGDFLTSPNNLYTLNMQDDGNLVLYDLNLGQGAIWASNTYNMAVSKAVMESDGNFVIYGCPDPIWATNTNYQDGAFIVLQDDGGLVIYGTTPIWASNIEDK